jgi:Phosphorylase superfamily
MGIVVLVPQGAEYQAVKRGLPDRSDFTLIAIPAGLQPVRSFLAERSRDALWSSVQQVIVMGLCGALNPVLQVGDRVLYQTCQNTSNQLWQCKYDLNVNAKLVKAVNTNIVIASKIDKQALRSRSGCDVVDMEGIAILEFFQNLNIPVTILRVVSDDAAGDIPDLSSAIDAQGKLRAGKLAIGMIKEPRKAIRLIRGAQAGLRVLSGLAGDLRGGDAVGG